MAVQRVSVSPASSREAKRKEIYKYQTPWTVYAMNWSVRQDMRFRIAAGSFLEDYSNKVTVGDIDVASVCNTVGAINRNTSNW